MKHLFKVLCLVGALSVLQASAGIVDDATDFLPKDADGKDCEDWRCVKDYVEENADDLPCTVDDEECWKGKLQKEGFPSPCTPDDDSCWDDFKNALEGKRDDQWGEDADGNPCQDMECYKEWTASHLDKLPCADVDDTQCWEDELANNPPCGDKSEDECKAAMLDDIVPNVKRVIDEDWVTFCFDVGDGTGDYLHITECIGVVLGDDEDGTDGNGDNSDGNGDNSDGKGDNSNDSGNGNGNDSGNGGDPNPP